MKLAHTGDGYFVFDSVDKYIHETGIGISFQIIFSELISKKIPV